MAKSRAFGLFLTVLLLLSVFLHAQSATAFYDTGRDLLNQERFYNAIEQFKSALELNPRYLGPIAGLAESYFALSEYEEALRYAAMARQLDRENMALVSLEGRIRIGLAQFAEARALFASIIAREPNNIDAQFGLAELEIAFGKTANAAVLYEQALRIAPYNRRALLSLVLIFDEAGDFDTSDAYLEQVLRFHPEIPQVQFIAAKHLFAKGEYNEAEYHVSVALDLNPGYLDATLLKSRIFLVREQYTEAAAVLQDVLSVHRDEHILWYNLGLAYSRVENIDGAIQAFARAFTLQPDDELSRIALENLLIAKKEIGDPLRARYAEYRFNKGSDYLERNYIDRAILEIRRGLILTPRAREGRLLYASLYELLGLQGRYLSELQVLIDLGHDDIEIANKAEIAESLQRDSLANRWNTSQYDLERYRHSINLFFLESDMEHFLAEEDIARFFRHLLLRHDGVDIVGFPRPAESFGDAFFHARSDGSDYFAVLETDEGPRHFALGWKLYSSNTGTLLADFAILRTGNDRITDALRAAADGAAGSLPFYAEILAREFDSVLIDAGSYDEVEVDQEFIILKGSVLDGGRDVLEIEYKEDDVLGTINITEVDELISVGTVVKDPFFDLVNLGDIVVFPPEDITQSTGESYEIPDDLYRAILKIR